MRGKSVIAIILGFLLIMSATGCDNPAINLKATVSAKYPEKIGFEDFYANRLVRENNPISEAYLSAVQTFSAKSITEIFSPDQRKQNEMYSPLSLYMALALATSGANNQTQDEMLSTLELQNLGVKQLEEQTGNLFRLLYTDNEIGKLQFANSIWLDLDISLKKPYLDTAAKDYYASLFSVDFKEKDTGEKISKWISDHTNGNLTGSKMPTNEAQIMALINTIYFYDEWIDKFDEAETKEEPFYCSDGEAVTCNFMNRAFGSHNFYDGEGYIRSSLGFKNNATMNFYLPDKGVDVYELISTQDKVATLLNTNNSQVEQFGKVIFKLPKFNYGANLNLKDAMKNMGMKNAFESDADFSAMTDQKIAYISDILQATHISIDEKGCEASAFTQIDYYGASPPKDTAEMILNRPFIYTITSSNGVILFAGVVNNPTKN